MLKHILFNRVRSDEGHVVKLRVFRGFAEYREGDHVAVIPVYPVSGQPLVRVSASTPIRWKEPFAHEPVSEERRKKIINSVVEALEFRKCRTEVTA